MSLLQIEIESIFIKTMGRCYICDRKIDFKKKDKQCIPRSWEIDLDIPLSKGGPKSFGNKYPACYSCAQEKGDFTRSEFIVYLTETYSDVKSGSRILQKQYCGLDTILD